MKCTAHWSLIQLFLTIMLIGLGQGEIVLTNKFIYKLYKVSDLRFVQDTALKYDIHILEQIFPSLYVFKHGELSIFADETYLTKLKKTFLDKVEYIEQVKYHLENEPDEKSVKKRSTRDVSQKEYGPYSSPDSTCYGMGIDEMWRNGNTGEGVVVGVLDVGVNRDIPDLKDRIDESLSYNFVNNNNKYSPEHFPSYPMESLYLTDHGNRCSGLIAAIRGNGICAAGVAPKSRIAALKVFEVIHEKLLFSKRFDTIMTTKGLSYRNDKIHIYSNSWGTVEHFAEKEKAPLSAIAKGVKEGRNNKGSIYVFPSEYLADSFANSVNTIAVNSVGQFGTIPTFAKPCACVLTSVYGKGNTLKSNYLITTSHGRWNCTNLFKGLSASTALVSGVIALSLQKRPDLSWRDVQHLTVAASEHRHLEQANNFKKNGAGYYYHSTFGFGMLNASKLVSLAEKWKCVPEQVIIKRDKTTPVKQRHNTTFSKQVADINIECNDVSCLNSIEHVVTTISFSTECEHDADIRLESPNKTVSILMTRNQSNHMTSTKRKNVDFLSVNFWGEDPNGVWRVIMRQYRNHKGTFALESVSLTLYGTGRQKKENNGDKKPKTRASLVRGDRLYLLMVLMVMIIIK